jgi:hypothetical protein
MPPFYGSVAQLGECQIYILKVVGSFPTRFTNLWVYNSKEEYLTVYQIVRFRDSLHPPLFYDELADWLRHEAATFDKRVQFTYSSPDFLLHQ